MKILIEKELEGWWITSEEARELSDKEIIELVNEDVCALLDKATWKVVRKLNECEDDKSCSVGIQASKV